MLADFVQHQKCGEYIHVDEWSEHVGNPCGDCFEAACGYEEPHAHGFACEAQCPCHMGLWTPRADVEIRGQS